MRLHRNPAKSGICFAWTPKQTSDGVVWLEHVHFKLVEGWGWGSGDSYVYERMIPQDRYDAGERAQAINEAIYFSEQLYGVKAKHLGDLPEAVQERLLSGMKAYETPPGDPKVFCNEYRDEGPTPCHYPFCARYDDTSMPRCGREKRSCPQSST